MIPSRLIERKRDGGALASEELRGFLDAYLDGVPADRIKQIHLAGHEHNGDYIVDTHDEPVPEYVLDLYAKAVDRFCHVPTMIERDANIPPFAELVRELQGVRRIAEKERTKVSA